MRDSVQTPFYTYLYFTKRATLSYWKLPVYLKRAPCCWKLPWFKSPPFTEKNISRFNVTSRLFVRHAMQLFERELHHSQGLSGRATVKNAWTICRMVAWFCMKMTGWGKYYFSCSETFCEKLLGRKSQQVNYCSAMHILAENTLKR